ncbi:hypothetical protein [Macrococcoides canis]|uniref:Uncharacterized protein n=1 Tax=Macrococcoides canis TaxID=1855823 RepID=A0A4R6C1V8_9STAP|nr:hypothetical protein [Macrococcus]TDM15182.1 hypothetical protein ETI04_10770 [Macrococcus canis]TDM29309.1 hypothetical protein ETI03_10835 [Macrococcus canis]TDM31999.1 hypothetical protein ETI13_10750 [Macrococcus canis]TDM38938.1 hypothetical protein ETI10_12735 [Macrococcus goetzii]TDM39915.1 hypothetical protein ETI09_10515 [Macrococcus canis]
MTNRRTWSIDEKVDAELHRIKEESNFSTMNETIKYILDLRKQNMNEQMLFKKIKYMEKNIFKIINLLNIIADQSIEYNLEKENSEDTKTTIQNLVEQKNIYDLNFNKKLNKLLEEL